MYLQDILDPEKYWNEELKNVGKDRLFACFTPDLTDMIGDSGDAPPPAPATNGLITGHAYSIIQAEEFNGRRFLR